MFPSRQCLAASLPNFGRLVVEVRSWINSPSGAGTPFCRRAQRPRIVKGREMARERKYGRTRFAGLENEQTLINVSIVALAVVVE